MSQWVTRLAPASAKCLTLPAVQPAPKSGICRASTKVLIEVLTGLQPGTPPVITGVSRWQSRYPHRYNFETLNRTASRLRRLSEMK